MNTNSNYPYYDFKGNLIESENDEKMRRKYGYNYGSLKNIYPNAYKLPEEEIKPLINKFYEVDEPWENTQKRVKEYIAQNEPNWKVNYFGETTNQPTDPYQDAKKQILQFEHIVKHPYLDKNGDNTNCIGNLNETYQEFASHPWQIRNTNRLANENEIKNAYYNLSKAPKKNYKADFYKDYTNLELPEEYCYQLLDQGIASRDRELRNGIPNFDKMDQHMKNAIMETHYTSNVLDFPKMKKAAKAMNKEGVCENLHRDEKNRSDMVDRNKWSFNECMKGGFYK